MFTHTVHAVLDPEIGDVFNSCRCSKRIPPEQIAGCILAHRPNAELISILIQDDRTGEGRVYFPHGTILEKE